MGRFRATPLRRAPVPWAEEISQVGFTDSLRLRVASPISPFPLLCNAGAPLRRGTCSTHARGDPPGVWKKYRKFRALVVGQEVFAKSTLNWGEEGGAEINPAWRRTSCVCSLAIFLLSTVWRWRAVASNLVTSRVAAAVAPPMAARSLRPWRCGGLSIGLALGARSANF